MIRVYSNLIRNACRDVANDSFKQSSSRVGSILNLTKVSSAMVVRDTITFEFINGTLGNLICTSPDNAQRELDSIQRDINYYYNSRQRYTSLSRDITHDGIVMKLDYRVVDLSKYYFINYERNRLCLYGGGASSYDVFSPDENLIGTIQRKLRVFYS